MTGLLNLIISLATLSASAFASPFGETLDTKPARSASKISIKVLIVDDKMWTNQTYVVILLFDGTLFRCFEPRYKLGELIFTPF